MEYTAVLNIRRMLKKRERLCLKFRQGIQIWGSSNIHGMITVLWDIFETLRWSISNDLVITRECGIKTHLIDGDDLLFNHMQRGYKNNDVEAGYCAFTQK